MSIARPLQTAFDVADERHVGPLPQSIVAGDNAALIASIAPLYLTGSVLDVTYGRGVWWRRFKPEVFAFHDLALDGVDCRALPYEASTFDTVCFDPPYIPTRAAHTASPKLKGRFRLSYGLLLPRTGREVEDLVAAELAMNEGYAGQLLAFLDGRAEHPSVLRRRRYDRRKVEAVA